MKPQTIIVWILFLTIIDQAIKIVINAYFFETNFEIIPSLLEFRPTFNPNYSYANDLLNRNFGIDMGLLVHLVLFLFVAIVITFACDFHQSIAYSKLLDVAFIFFMAGLCCSLIGNLIWKKGGLDYIYLKPLFVFDLKDVYINCFVVLFAIYRFRKAPELDGITMEDVKLYIKKRLKIVDKKN